MDSDENFLILLVDVSQLHWRSQSKERINFNDVVKNIIVFSNAYVLMNRRNKLMICAYHPEGSKTIFPILSNGGLKGDAEDFVPTDYVLQKTIADGLLGHVSLERSTTETPIGDCSRSSKCTLANVLSKALCCGSRQKQLLPKLQPRILVMSIQPDEPHTYNSMMNSIFSAQKLEIPVDALVLSEQSSFLQQACFLTKGIYQNLPNRIDMPKNQAHTMIQILLTFFLPSLSMRGKLKTPFQSSVEFTASCFCHRKTVSFAFLCSVCLSLTCETSDVCITCETPVRKRLRTIEMRTQEI